MPAVETRETLHRALRPVTGSGHDYDPVLQLVGDRPLVLLGEASHGTHEFYQARADITRRLVAERGFNAVAVEADWPDAARVNRYVLGRGDDRAPDEALGDFRRFPAWMWRNTVVRHFIGWLREWNAAHAGSASPVGFHGLDLYSLYSSIDAVLAYLARVDPEAAERARYRYACFEHYAEDSQAYGYAAAFDLNKSCEEGAVRELLDLQREALDYARRDGRVAEDEYFFAEQNARVVKNAEHYYRSMFGGRVSSWNLRDRHMAETLEALRGHLRAQGVEPKVVVWAHNSHLGDARATQMGDEGELNVGQLVRERHGDDAALVGFTTYSGWVTAASDWGAVAERKRIRPALDGSYERLLHDTRAPRFVLPLREPGVRAAMAESRLERAIGVIYRPGSERLSHYFYATLPDQFDAVLHFDHTEALRPLEVTSTWETGEPAETFPTGV